MRYFETGASRNDNTEKYDFEGFLSPLVIEAYGRYMHKHRKQADGKVRDADNWQKGIPKNVYIKSAWRHFLDLWFLHRGYERVDENAIKISKKEALMALLFNIMGYAYEELKKKK